MRILDANLDVKLKALRKNPYFNDLSEEMLKEIAAQTQLRGFERGEVLFWEEDPCAGLHIIEEGSVKLYRISAQGRQYIIRVLQEGIRAMKSLRLMAGRTRSTWRHWNDQRCG
jgi:signal-transduction protein with cAMP-binding, CBS, and nucleotidyltransferase domain